MKGEDKMLTTIGFILFGYFTGSLLFARYFSNLFCGKDVTVDTPDSNPGTYNAYTYGGFWCGALTLVCDLLKGFLPVFLYIRVSGGTPLGLVLVMSAPALGHIFPIWHKFDGGKGIAVSFGVLLGLAPNMLPVLTLALTYLLFSLVFKVNPHFYRLILTYSTAFRNYPADFQKHSRDPRLRCGIRHRAAEDNFRPRYLRQDDRTGGVEKIRSMATLHKADHLLDFVRGIAL